MKYQEARNCNGGSSYAVVNESLEIWDDILKDVEGVKKAASICSGGEVAFFNVLPKVEEQLDLIDNSLASMYYAIGKYHIIEKLGAAKGLELLKHGQPVFEPAQYDKYGRYYGSSKPVTKGPSYDCYLMFEEANAKIGNASNRGYLDNSGGNVGSFYAEFDLARIKTFRANRSKINFIHGDLSDLEASGPYDFLYLSNALDYGIVNPTPLRGEKKGHEVYKVTEWVKPGGYIALTGHASDIMSLADRVVLRQEHGRSTYGRKRQPSELSWTYRLLKNEADPNYEPRRPKQTYSSYRY